MTDTDVSREVTVARTTPGPSRAALADCLRTGVSAPSIHNSQPWLFRIRDAGIDIHADRARQLTAIDPAGRELLISTGAALFNIRLAIGQLGRSPEVVLWPEPGEPDLVARIEVGEPAAPDPALSTLYAAIPRRHTNRRPFTEVLVPPAVLAELAVAATAEGADLRVADVTRRRAILELVRTADRRLRSDGVHRAGLTEWTVSGRHRRTGVPAQFLGAWGAMETVPLRDFGLTQPQLRRSTEPDDPYPVLAVLSTSGDTPEDWVRAGQALERVLLAATVAGLSATPMSQPLAVPALRELVRDPASGYWPQVILRLGYGVPTASTPRRPLSAVLLPDQPA